MRLKNPIIPGFYPDPSICRRGDDYYIITSSFEYFPGIPLFHSQDLVHWEQLGHVLTRSSQLDLTGVHASKGIYASTIRYREQDGYFYVVTTLVKDPPYYGNVNFYVRAKDPAGPWSDPVVIEGAEGIDPTLFFDEDKVYYLGNLRPYPDLKVTLDRHVWIQELELETGRLIGERKILLTDGALYHAATPEGPHMYKVDGWYYLLIAEGGTEMNHSVTVFRSKNVFGPFEGNPRNPILTHRNLRRDSAVKCTGHADMIRLANDEWWAILLGTRADGGRYTILGRETFAVPMIWEEGWPVFSPDTGRVENEFPAPELTPFHPEPISVCDHFEEGELRPDWNMIRTPKREIYSLRERDGVLRLFLNEHTLKEEATPAFVGRRQRDLCFAAETLMEFVPTEKSAAGIVMMLNDRFHISMLCEKGEAGDRVAVRRCFGGEDTCMGEIPFAGNRVWLRVTANYQSYSFYAAFEAGKWQCVAEGVDGSHLCREIAGGFTGAYIGLYGHDLGETTDTFADYHWFEYRGIPEE